MHPTWSLPHPLKTRHASPRRAGDVSSFHLLPGAAEAFDAEGTPVGDEVQ
ncbi:MAG: hypothetical protein K8R36_25345 [Planctomycetales bacterium]|nr:hypothetical protein [Planctomycetales bacterium]